MCRVAKIYLSERTKVNEKWKLEYWTYREAQWLSSTSESRGEMVKSIVGARVSIVRNLFGVLEDLLDRRIVTVIDGSALARDCRGRMAGLLMLRTFRKCFGLSGRRDRGG